MLENAVRASIRSLLELSPLALSFSLSGLLSRFPTNRSGASNGNDFAKWHNKTYFIGDPSSSFRALLSRMSQRKSRRTGEREKQKGTDQPDHIRQSSYATSSGIFAGVRWNSRPSRIGAANDNRGFIDRHSRRFDSSARTRWTDERKRERERERGRDQTCSGSRDSRGSALARDRALTRIADRPGRLSA